MSQKKIEIETSLLVQDSCEQCIARIQRQLSLKKGIEKVHVKGKPLTLCLHYDPNLVSLAAVQRMTEEMGAEMSGRYQHCRIPIMCTGSADAVLSATKALEATAGVLHANVNHAAGIVSVAYDSKITSLVALEEVVTGLGFKLCPRSKEPFGQVEGEPDQALEKLNEKDKAASGGDDKHVHAHGHGHAPAFIPAWLAKRWILVLAFGAGLFLAIGFVGEHLQYFSPTVARLFYMLAYLAGGYDIATHALPGLLKGRFDTDILMLAAAAGAAALGKWSEGAFLLFLFALGHAGEHYALERARSAVDALGQLMPKTAKVRRGKEIQEVDVDSILLQETVVVAPGERIPVDGKVLKGRSAVDQSPITGESAPVNKDVGEEVFAGTINQENALEIEVTKLSKDNTLHRVMQMVAEAQEQKSPTQQFTQRFTSRFVPIVLGATLLMIVVPPLLPTSFGYLSWSEAFYRAMLLLVGSSPCALALGTPAAVLAGIGQAARHGVLIKGGVHLENLGSIKALAMDKTGTLTEGRFKVTDIEVYRGPKDCEPARDEVASVEELLSLAASVEQQSKHPLAAAVVNRALEQQIKIEAADGLENLAGRGVRSRVNGRSLLIGSPRLIREELPEVLTGALVERVDELQAEGKTVMLVCREGALLGLLALSDEPRKEAKEALAKLSQQGISTLAMLTGDNQKAAERVGGLVGVTKIYSGLLPGDKVEVVRELRETIGKVAMIGDGVNDAPALALADVGIAMGGAGTAVALETADVALMSDDLSKLPFAVSLSRASKAIIKQNIAIAMAVILSLIVCSIFGLTNLGVTVVFHEGSTIVVVFNALRLLGYQPEPVI